MSSLGTRAAPSLRSFTVGGPIAAQAPPRKMGGDQPGRTSLVKEHRPYHRAVGMRPVGAIHCATEPSTAVHQPLKFEPPRMVPAMPEAKKGSPPLHNASAQAQTVDTRRPVLRAGPVEIIRGGTVASECGNS